MRDITEIIVHCSDSPLYQNDAEDVAAWHTDEPPHGNGWSDVGYHFIIEEDGTIVQGRPVHIQGAHAARDGHNHHSIGTCMMGGRPEEGREGSPTDQTPTNRFTLGTIERTVQLCAYLCITFGLQVSDVKGHGEVDDRKTCPNYPMDAMRRSIAGRIAQLTEPNSVAV